MTWRGSDLEGVWPRGGLTWRGFGMEGAGMEGVDLEGV